MVDGSDGLTKYQPVGLPLPVISDAEVRTTRTEGLPIVTVVVVVRW